EVDAGRFRQDLYFRIAVLPIAVPPLRQRRDDVPLLVQHFATASANRVGRRPCELAADALDLLCHYHWPGNVRELENLVTRASVLGNSSCITAADLRLWLIDPTGHCLPDAISPSAEPPEAVTVGMRLDDMERRLI